MLGNFLGVHRNSLDNIDVVTDFYTNDRFELVLTDGSLVVVSQSKLSLVRKILKNIANHN